MKYADIHFPDVANGPGIRVSLFVSGCTHGCPECFNQEAWDFNYGRDFTEDTIQEILQMCEDPADGLTLLGGEPLHPKNQQAVYALAKAYKAHFPHKTLWCFTGYTLEEVLDTGFGTPVKMDLLKLIDVLVDGRFQKELKDIRLKFRGSANQRLIDLPATLGKGTVQLWGN